MAIGQQTAQLSSSRDVILPARVLFALDSLDSSEQEAVQAALQALAQVPAWNGIDERMHRLAGADPIYVIRAAPKVRLFVRLLPHAPVEVLDLVRPETLEKTFGVADPVPERP